MSRSKATDETITLEQWAFDLGAAEGAVAEGWTTEEIAVRCGLSREVLRKRLRHAVQQGKWCCCGWRRSRRMDDRPCQVPVYAPCKPQKGKDAR